MNFAPMKEFLDLMAASRTPGNAVSVYREGKLVYSYASGYSDLETKTKMTGDEFFNIYSCSKPTTVTAGAQLVERGILHLNDPLYWYMPEFTHMKVSEADGTLRDARNPILVRDLFQMTTGFNYNINAPEIQKIIAETNGKAATLDVIRRAIAIQPLCFEPGTKWQYSLSHDVLAGLIEVVTGKKFRDYVKENIFDPLGVKDTYYHHQPGMEEKMASQYSFVPNGSAEVKDLVEAQKSGSNGDGIYKLVSKDCPYTFGSEYDSGGAGIVTKVDEYAKVAAALANNGVGGNGERILSPHTIELMTTNTLTTPELLQNYCWGQHAGFGYGLGVATHMDRTRSGSLAPMKAFGWGGAAGASFYADTTTKTGCFYVQHIFNPREDWYQPRLRNVLYKCLDD